MSDDPYTTSKPTHLRIYREETGDEYPWHIDGADNDGRYTEQVFRYESAEECIGHAAFFIAETELDGVVWKWDAARKTRLRRNDRKE